MVTEGFVEGQVPNIEACKSMAASIGKELEDGGMSMDQTQGVMQEFEAGKAQYINSSRNFGDIYNEGPETSAEAALLISAMAFLDPSELQNAANSNKSLNTVAAEVEASKLKDVAKNMVQDLERDGQETEVELQPEQSGPSLNVSYGVLDEMGKSLAEAGIAQMDEASPEGVQSPNTPTVAGGHGKGGGIEK